MSSQPVDRLHPVVEFAERLKARLISLADQPFLSMTPEEQRRALSMLAEDEAQLAALKLRLLAHAEETGTTTGTSAGSAADWLAVETRQVRRDARSDLKLAITLEQHERVAAGMTAGEVNPAQARAIVAALDRLPRTGEFAVTESQRRQAEAHLVGLAAEHDAKALRILGRRVLEVIAPDLAERFDGRILEQEEAKAARRTTFMMWEDDEGTAHGRFRIPARHGQMLRKMILALTSPARSSNRSSAPDQPDLSAPVRDGVAFTELIESITADQLPKSGGCGATVVVTMTLDQLLADLDAAGVCTLDTGGAISAAEARRLACRAGIIPIVLGGKSQVLDVGRKRRLHTEGMRLAMGVRDGGCTTEGCETPPGLCHAHHDTPWSAGGDTDVKNGRLLCPRHHRRIHDPRYQSTHLTGGKVSFHRRT